MKKGLIDLLRYYSTGIGLIYIIYVIFGHSYVHAPAPYHFAIIVMYFITVTWLIITINSFFLKNRKTIYNKIVLLINAIILFNFTLWMYLISK